MGRRSLFSYRAERSPNAWLYLLPSLIFIFTFSVYPLVRTFIMAFHSNNGEKMVAWKNFIYVLKDSKFHRALGNTSLFSFVVVPVALILSMLIALTIHSKIKGAKFFETIFFFPYITSVIAVGIVFRYIFNGKYGILNLILQWFNLGPYEFLENPKLNMTALIIFGVWSSLAFNVIILLSGLRNIDPDYYKVAEMFGATEEEQFRKITLPSLLPIITFLLATNFIGAFKVYGQVFSLFNGSPGVGGKAMTAVFYVYNKFYREMRLGHGTAAAVILFFIILIFTLIQRALIKRVSE